MKLLIADTGPVLHLHEAGALHLLPLLGEIHVTPMVLAELRRLAPTIFDPEPPAWLTVVEPSSAASARAAQWVAGGLLDEGEAEALAHALEAMPDLFVTDDTAARLMAESLRVPVRGSLGVVLYCAATGRVDEPTAKAHLTALSNRSTLWLSARVRQAAAEALAKIFP